MLAAITLLLGALLVAMALVERPVRVLPLSPALIYLVLGWATAWSAGGLDAVDPRHHAGWLVVATEWVVNLSLFAVGLRIPLPAATRAWRVAIVLASAGMAATIVLAAALAHWLLALGWSAAFLLASILAPTDPVLASEVQIRSDSDRDAVRLSLSAEGGLNDGTAFPAVMLALGWLGLHELGEHARHWWLRDLLWSIGGGIVVGWLVGRACGTALNRRLAAGHAVAWDELVFVGVIALGYGAATLLGVSTFLAVFVAGIALFERRAHGERDLPQRMHAFAARCERLIEVLVVLAVGAAMTWVQWRWSTLLFALGLLLIVRPLAVLLVVRRRAMPAAQRRLVAWFGIRGIGTLFYLAYALHREGLDGALARELVSACLVCVAASIVLHGVSATPLMRRRQ